MKIFSIFDIRLSIRYSNYSYTFKVTFLWLGECKMVADANNLGGGFSSGYQKVYAKA